MNFYATADKSRLVNEDDPEAAFVVNPADPGEFRGLLKAQEEARQAKAAAAEERRAAEQQAAAADAEPERRDAQAIGPREEASSRPAAEPARSERQSGRGR
jgi:hypothetical protein